MRRSDGSKGKDEGSEQSVPQHGHGRGSTLTVLGSYWAFISLCHRRKNASNDS